MIKIVPLKESHVLEILKDRTMSPNVSREDLIKTYLSPGSLSSTLIIDDVPIVCGGIVNLNWKRGEAWILTSSLFNQYKKTCYKAVKTMLEVMSKTGNFVRVQSLVEPNSLNCKMIKRLGFEFEGVLRRYGPDNQDLWLYGRFK